MEPKRQFRLSGLKMNKISKPMKRARDDDDAAAAEESDNLYKVCEGETFPIDQPLFSLIRLLAL